jgi:hypothetical protein
MRLPHSIARLADALAGARHATGLLLEGRFWLFLVADLTLLFMAFLSIAGEGARGNAVYGNLVVLPLILLALPALSTLVALERRAGSLDLALAVPSTESYFLRRAAPVATFFLLQGWLFLLLTFERWEDLLRGLAQSLVITLLLVGLVLFWGVRLRTSGAVLAASWLSVLLLSHWVFIGPALDTSMGPPERLLGIPLPLLSWYGNLLVLLLTTVIVYLYARQRLRRPESMLS